MAVLDEDRIRRGGSALAESAAAPWTARPGRARRPPEAPERLHVLIVGDDERGLDKLEGWLAKVRRVRITAERAAGPEGLARLRAGAADACLVDERDGRGVAFLRTAHDHNVEVPIVVVAADPRLEIDLESMALGAADFLDQHHLDEIVLERVIRYALARRRQTMSLVRLARQDQLTGLANRLLLDDRLQRALAFARRNDRLVAVMILDLNGFKRVNDDLGHAAGDRLLCIVGERLKARLRETDTIARTGGDEFALVIENLARPEHAALVAQKLLDAVAPPIPLAEHEVRLSASLGIALHPKDGEAAADLLRQADAAMYRAKSEGGNVFRFASAQVERRVQRGAILASDVRRGLEHNEFVLHYQPQVALLPIRLGVAAIPVWQHPELGAIAADRFLGLAEAAGLSDPLMDWLMAAATDQLAVWRDFGLERLHLALPMIVRRQLGWSDLADRLAAQIRRAQVPAQAIEIEVEEARLLADLDAGGEGALKLRALGVRLSVDGYGSGPTSLRCFQERVVDTVKLDRSLLADVPLDPTRTATMTAILELARQLNIRTVASGADRHDQVAFLRAHGCTAVQALMSSPAVPASACARWLERAAARRDGSIRPLEVMADAEGSQAGSGGSFRV